MVIILLLLSSKDLEESTCVIFTLLLFLCLAVTAAECSLAQLPPPSTSGSLCSHKSFGSNENMSKLS